MMDRALVRESARRQVLRRRRAARPPAASPPTLPEAPAPPEDNAARALLERLGTTEWMQRRVEETCLVGHSLLLRRVHVTVTIAGTGKVALAPIGRFSKRSTRRERVFMVRDEEDRLVPALTSKERDHAVKDALAAATAGLVGPERRPFIESLIAAAVQAPNPQKAKEYVKELAEELKDDVGDLTEVFLTVMRDVAQQWLLLIPVSADSKTHQFSYEFLQTSDLEPNPKEKRSREIAARLGWLPTEITMRMSGMVLTPVFHGIFDAPEGLALVDSRVHGLPHKSAAPSTDGTTGPEAGEEAEGWGDATRHQVYLESEAPTGRPGVVIRLRPRRDGLVRNGSIVGLVISALLLAGAFFHSQLTEATKQADAATALLLAVPSFFLLDAARSSEHRFIANTLWPIRFVLLMTGLAAFLAAIFMLSSGDAGEACW
jgi:hypothetical protein